MLAAAQLSSPVPPTEIVPQLDGTSMEMTDIPIVSADLGVAHNKVLRLPAISDLPRERRGTLLSLCHDLFIESWDQVVFGPCIQGAVFELEMGKKPERFSYLDGYLTVFLEPSPAHMHLCIGPHQGLKNQTPDELARIRPCARATFVRQFGKNCTPASWSIQLFNGANEQMITFFLPNPYYDRVTEKPNKVPNWGSLKLWNDLRARYLGETVPQPLPTGTPEDDHG